MTVREMVNEIRDEVRDTELAPERAAILAAQLSALLGNIAAEIREAEMAYNVRLLALLTEHAAKNRAEVHAKTTPEYARRREAEDLHRVTLEMVRSLRKLQDTYREEMRLSR